MAQWDYPDSSSSLIRHWKWEQDEAFIFLPISHSPLLSLEYGEALGMLAGVYHKCLPYTHRQPGHSDLLSQVLFDSELKAKRKEQAIRSIYPAAIAEYTESYQIPKDA